MHKIFIDGSKGTTGLRIKERLKERSDIEILELPQELRKDSRARKEISNESDLVFLCLSDEVAKEAALQCKKEVTIIDASSAHRINPSWVYGMPELSSKQRSFIATSKRIANCGCHATGFIALVRPLIENNLIANDYPLCAHSITGYSGGGKKMIETYTSFAKSNLLESPNHYALMQNHKHLPEMKKYAGLSIMPAFQPIVADFYSGMSVSISLFKHLLKKTVNICDIKDIYREYYKDSPLIFVDDEDVSSIAANEMSGFDDMKIRVSGNDTILINACFDNLGKGASGSAIQNMNIVLGKKEEKGLVLSKKRS